ncbi:MAG: NADP-dependent oxidoreductase [Pseudobdellovibrionaceae bacterium]
MKAARIHSYGDSAQVKIEDSPQPEVKNNEVLVKIHDASVNPVDWKIREGYMKSSSSKFPLTLGQDFSGEIVEVGPGVTSFKKGDDVFGFASGSYAEFTCASVDRIALIPASLNYEVAASIPTAGLTAYQLLVEQAKIKENQTILIHGAAGGVGSLAVQIAHWKKARVFATASSDDKTYLEKIGAERVIDYKTNRFEELLTDLDVVIDLVGGDTIARSYQIMKRNGIALSVVGGCKESEASAHGIRCVNFVMHPNAKDLSDVGKLFAQGILNLRIGAVLPLAEAKRAQDLNKKGHTHGKIVLKMT